MYNVLKEKTGLCTSIIRVNFQRSLGANFAAFHFVSLPFDTPNTLEAKQKKKVLLKKKIPKAKGFWLQKAYVA